MKIRSSKTPETFACSVLGNNTIFLRTKLIVACFVAIVLLQFLGSRSTFNLNKSPLPKDGKAMGDTLKAKQDHEQKVTTPSSCTEKQLNAIQTILPNKEILQQTTSCPDATWLEDVVEMNGSTGDVESLAILGEIPRKHRKTPPTAIFVGCNKACDAVNTLRMLSLNPEFDKFKWISTVPIFGSVCNQHKSAQFPLPVDWNTSRNAQVYCIEAMPSTFAKIDRAARHLGWQDSLRIVHAAMADPSNETSILFPNAQVGREDLGLKDCLNPEKRGRCESVPLLTLDSFVEKHDDLLQEIDYLSIDVEGNDWPVMMGAMNLTLPRVKYLEFEYHVVGRWQDYQLKTVIDALQKGVESFPNVGSFVCYWAGRGGKLWRITDCWMDHYNDWKQWSNIACVHWERAPTLAARMEARFLDTLNAVEASLTWR